MNAREKAKKLYEAGFGSLAKVAMEIGESVNNLKYWKTEDKKNKKDWIKPTNQPNKNKKKVVSEKLVRREITAKDMKILNSSELTEKQKSFCIYYIQSFNATQSAIKAGYSPKTAYSIGQENLKKPAIKGFLQELKESYAKEIYLDGKRILERHSKIAFSNIFDFIDGERKLKPIDEIDGTLIKDFTYKKEDVEFEGGSNTKTSITLKVEDRKPSLNFLTKYLELDPTFKHAEERLELEKERLEFEKSKLDDEEGVKIPTAEDTREFVTEEFKETYDNMVSAKYLYNVEKGGRGSSKSSHVAIALTQIIIDNPLNFLCVRKVANTLKDSMYEQLQWAIDLIGVGGLFRVKKAPLELIYLPRGNKIMFRGADDPAKIKSIKSSKFPLAGLWIEELAEFKTEEEVSTIEKSILRDELRGIDYRIFYSYNPPKRKQSWVNKKYESTFIPKNTFVHHSDYTTNPYISKEFIEEAEHVKTRSPLKYRFEYLGEPIGSGVVPFNNLVFRTISDEEINSFDNIKQGVDWGYAADPAHFGRWHYDRTRRVLYAVDEINGIKLSNRKLSDKIINKKYNDTLTVADSAEPKSVAEVKGYGVKIKGAKKGPGSIEYGEKWLDDLEEIVIDPERTPFTAKEFEDIDYKVDRDGNTRSELEDKDNHSIDSVRYACEDEMKNRVKGKTFV